MDEVLNIACDYYNFSPKSQGQESSFFLMFGRYVYIPTLANLQLPKLRYLGDSSTLHFLEMLREMYMLTAVNLKKMRETDIPKTLTKDIP